MLKLHELAASAISSVCCVSVIRSLISIKVKNLQRKIFWLVFIVLGLVADFTLPFLWSLILTLPIIVLSWWIAYRSGWFE